MKTFHLRHRRRRCHRRHCRFFVVVVIAVVVAVVVVVVVVVTSFGSFWKIFCQNLSKSCWWRDICFGLWSEWPSRGSKMDFVMINNEWMTISRSLRWQLVVGQFVWHLVGSIDQIASGAAVVEWPSFQWQSPIVLPDSFSWWSGEAKVSIKNWLSAIISWNQNGPNDSNIYSFHWSKIVPRTSRS